MNKDGTLPFKSLFNRVKGQVIQNCQVRADLINPENNFVGPSLKPYTVMQSLYSESYHQWSNPGKLDIDGYISSELNQRD